MGESMADLSEDSSDTDSEAEEDDSPIDNNAQIVQQGLVYSINTLISDLRG